MTAISDPLAGAEVVEVVEVAPDTPRARLWRRFRRNRVSMVAACFIVLVVGTALAAPLVAPNDPARQFTATKTDPVDHVNEAPSHRFLLGTDSVGRDQLSRLIYGARASIEVSFFVVAFAIAMALPLGLVAGYFGRWIDAVIMRCMDALFAFPALTLALAITAALGKSLLNASIAIAIVFVPGFVRLVRAHVLAVREETFVEASRSVGVGEARMLLRHILPNVASPLIVQVALSFGYALLAEAGLSFLGFGVQPPTPSWGVMLQSAYGDILTTQWPLVPPGLVLGLTVLAFNLVGDGLRDALGRETFTEREMRR